MIIPKPIILYITILFMTAMSKLAYERRVAATGKKRDKHTHTSSPRNIPSTYRDCKEEAPPRLLPHDLIYANKRNTAPIVNEEYKIIFFQVAKAASSQWTRFFMRLNDNPNWCSDDYHLHSHSLNQLSYLTDYPLDEAERMMKSSNYTKAIFVRHPKPRLLSAFLDKAVNHTDRFGNITCQSYARHGKDLEECIEKHEDFSFFLNNITTTLHKNVHWRSIYSRIDEKWWPFINFVGYMDTISQDTERFLQSIRSEWTGMTAWDAMGKTGWSDDERDCSGGTSAFLQMRGNHHQTKARERMLSYYTPELEKVVESRYADDLNNRFFELNEIKLFPDGDGDTA